MKKFWYPQFDGINCHFFRLGGPGLGNLLFPWARAIVGASINNEKLIYPVWSQIKIGPYIRREIDARSYANVFSPINGDIVSLNRIIAILGEKKLQEQDVADGKCIGGGVVFVVGLGGYFEPLLKHRKLIYAEFLKRLNVKYSNILRRSKSSEIAIHVRRGDFREPVSITDSNCTRTPLNWYVGIVNVINKYSPSQNFIVYSDGSDDDIMDLLKIPSVTRAAPGDAMEHICCISRSRALLASGSTFSMWAAFLGEIPVLYYPGQMTERVVGDLGIFEDELYVDQMKDCHCAKILV